MENGGRNRGACERSNLDSLCPTQARAGCAADPAVRPANLLRLPMRAGQRALDASSLWDEFVIVRMAVIYRGRPLPLSWVVLQQKSTMVAFENYKKILKEAAMRLSKNCRVILLADRGFGDNNLFCAARDLG